MKIKYWGSPEMLTADVKATGVPGRWRSRNGGAHRQFVARTGEFLSYWPATGTIVFQGEADGPLRGRLLAHRDNARASAPPPACDSARAAADASLPGATASRSLPTVGASNWLPPAYTQEAERDDRFRRVDELYADVPPNEATAELIYSAVQQALMYLPDDNLHPKLCAVAGALAGIHYPIGLFSPIAKVVEITVDDDY